MSSSLLNQGRLLLSQLQDKRLDCGDENGIVEFNDVSCLADSKVWLRLGNDNCSKDVRLGLRLLLVMLDDFLEADLLQMIHLMQAIHSEYELCDCLLSHDKQGQV